MDRLSFSPFVSDLSSLFEQSLLGPPKASPQPESSTPPPSTSTNSTERNGATNSKGNKPNGGAVRIKRQRGSDASAPHSSPATQAPAARRNVANREWFQKELTEDTRSRASSTATASVRATSNAESEPASKRAKLAGEGSVPSLLSRLAVTSKDPPRQAPQNPKRRPGSEVAQTQPRRGSPQQPRADAPAPPGGYNIKGAEGANAQVKRPSVPTRPQTQQTTQSQPGVPAGGFSIKGAARRSQPSPRDDAPSSLPLLDRLAQGDAGGRGRRRKSKT